MVSAVVGQVQVVSDSRPFSSNCVDLLHNRADTKLLSSATYNQLSAGIKRICIDYKGKTANNQISLKAYSMK